MKSRRSNRTIDGINYIILLIIIALFLFPIYWMVVTSLQHNSDLFMYPPRWWPTSITFHSYIEVLQSTDFLYFYRNTIIVSVGTTCISIIVSIFAGYVFSRYQFRGSNLVLIGYLSTQMFPKVTLLIGMYSIYSTLNLLDTLWALILANASIVLPFTVMLMKGFFDSISKELEEAAEIDGSSRFNTLFKVIVPLTAPGILAISIYSFLMSWDDFIFGLTLISSMDMRTLTSGIALKYIGETADNWSGATAAAVVTTLPVVLLFMLFQRYMVDGLTAGGVKE